MLDPHKEKLQDKRMLDPHQKAVEMYSQRLFQPFEERNGDFLQLPKCPNLKLVLDIFGIWYSVLKNQDENV